MRCVAPAMACVLLGAGCASSRQGGTVVDDDFVAPGLNPDQGESIPTVRFYLTAEENWNEAERQLNSKRYLAAQQFYAYIRTKFPYSQFAVLSDLRIADCQFEREHYIEAIDSYRNFARLHPTHEEVPYSVYRTGLAYYEQIPSSWFLLPPPEEKDQSSVKDAARAMSVYLQRFPDHDFIEEARKVFKDVQGRLLSHERYVANFYRKTGHYPGYVMRLKTMKTKFDGLALDAALLLELARAQARLGRTEEVEATFAEMQLKFPEAAELQQRQSVVDEATERRNEMIGDLPPPLERAEDDRSGTGAPG